MGTRWRTSRLMQMGEKRPVKNASSIGLLGLDVDVVAVRTDVGDRAMHVKLILGPQRTMERQVHAFARRVDGQRFDPFKVAAIAQLGKKIARSDQQILGELTGVHHACRVAVGPAHALAHHQGVARHHTFVG